MTRKEQLLVAEKLLKKISDHGTYFSMDEVFFFWQAENVDLKYQGPMKNLLLINGLVDEFGAGLLINDKGEKALKAGLEKFLDSENEPTPSTFNLHIGDKGNIQKNYGTIGESMNQVSEPSLSSEKYEIKKQTRQPTVKPNKNISKYEKWTLILAGLSILATIILKLLDYI
jgi:hypothetical protein